MRSGLRKPHSICNRAVGLLLEGPLALLALHKADIVPIFFAVISPCLSVQGISPEPCRLATATVVI